MPPHPANTLPALAALAASGGCDAATLARATEAPSAGDSGPPIPSIQSLVSTAGGLVFAPCRRRRTILTEEEDMQASAKLFGHPIHQMLIVFPLGLLATGAIFDVIHLVTGNPRWAEVAYWMITAGIVGGLVAALFGLIDWLGIPGGTRAKRIGLLHGGGNLVVVLLFAGSWLMRRDNPTAPEALALVLSFAGTGLALVTAWLGGELVSRLGIGVDDGAHVNAPSSLSDRPASEDVGRRSAGA
jgi:uncharacterized membrane protein